MINLAIAAWVLIANPGLLSGAQPKEAAYFATREACEVAAIWMTEKRRIAEAYRCFPTGAQ